MRMNWFLLSVTLMMLVHPNPASAKVGEVPAENKIAIASPDELAADGWTEVEPELWRLTAADGSEQQLTFGDTARQRVLTKIDRELASLADVESLSDHQLARFFSLSAQRDQIERQARIVGSEKGAVSKPACAGGASFVYNFFSGQNNGLPAYFASLSSTYTGSVYSPGPFTTFSTASICAFGNCSTPSASEVEGYYPSVTSSATASLVTGVPFFCFGMLEGWVMTPVYDGCQPMVEFEMSKRCSDF